MLLPNWRRVSLRITPGLMFVLGGCSLLNFGELTRLHGSGAGTGPDSGGQTTGGASGDAGEGGEGGRAGNGGRGGDDTGGAGAGNGGVGGFGGDTGGGGTGGAPMSPDAGGGEDAGPPEVPPECANGRQDDKETDKDCGGDNRCPRCKVRDTCRNDDDCISGRCQGGFCEPATCDDNRANGNETGTDCGGPDDCARCEVGQGCEGPTDCEILPNSQRICSEENRCASECLGDFLNCDTAKGCEVNADDDVLNCGDCDIQCSDNHGTPDCNGGVCRPACDAGYDSCGSDDDNDGCETDILTSAAHCGGCDQACSSECVEGDCCPLLTNQSVPNTVSGGCFTIQPTQPNCTLVVQNTDSPVAFTTTSTCNAAGTLQTGQGNRFNATCRTTFHLANTSTVHIAWWHDSCN